MATHSLQHMLIACFIVIGASASSSAASFEFSTGDPDGLIATASRPSSGGKIEVETADDFILSQPTSITSGTFTGLFTAGQVYSVQNVVLEIYRVFPLDSTVPPSGDVPTRDNSPSDVALATRDASAGEVSFTTTSLGSFTVANSVINGINPVPVEFTGGEGPVTGEEVVFSFTLPSALDLDVGHYFFVPQIQLSDGDFLWLSAPRPIMAPGTPIVPDLQSWIRNDSLDTDWLRIGTDITHQGPFNAAFSLAGDALPEPAGWTMMVLGVVMVGARLRRRRAAMGRVPA